MAYSNPALGAPGLYRKTVPRSRGLSPAAMDLCAFVGVAPRGPVREPIVDETWAFDAPNVESDRPRQRSVATVVDSFDAYRQLYGGFEGPGRLPYAVASYFANGGRRAVIVRVVHDYGDPGTDLQAVARGAVAGTSGVIELDARNEGEWGNGLRAAMGFRLSPLLLGRASEGLPAGSLFAAEDERLIVGAALLARYEDGTREFRFVTALEAHQDSRPDSIWRRIELDLALTRPLEDVVKLEVLLGQLEIDDGDGRTELHQDLGLSRAHPRWAGTVLCYESQLVRPVVDWVETMIEPADLMDLPASPRLAAAERFSGGEDRYAEIESADMFDASPVADRAREPGDGVHAIIAEREVATLVVPDLYVPEIVPEPSDVGDTSVGAGPEFAPCVPREPDGDAGSVAASLEGLMLDPSDPDDRDEIIALQRRLVAFADTRRDFVVLLDVPPGSRIDEALEWRGQFRSSFAAAYHPWPIMSRAAQATVDPRDRLEPVMINPSAVAAGVISGRELESGIPTGPANVVAQGIVALDESLGRGEHDRLHPRGINAFVAQPWGVELTAARTLATNTAMRQLSVRRLMISLRRVLERQMQWAVFEPNGPVLWARVRRDLTQLLRGYHRQGAFGPANEADAFFVRCDASMHPPRILDAGQLQVEIGIAPAEPIEFIIFRVVRTGDGNLSIAESSERSTLTTLERV